MKSALLTKAALCICPPAIVATTVATVPPVKRAVHHLTKAYEPHRPAAPKGPPCVPVQHKTFASTLPAGTVLEEPTPPEVIANPAVTPPPGPLGPPPINPPQILVPPISGGVPEPAAWMTMVLGFGMIGAGIRQRRRQASRSRRLAMAQGAGDGTIGSGGGAGSLFGGAGGGFGLAALLSMVGPARAGTKLAQVGSKALHSSMLAKAAMCVCPPVAMALGTAAVPPLRHAVYSATAPKVPKPVVQKAVVNSGVPCVPVDVPTAAESVRQSGDQLAVFKPAPGFPG